MDLNDYQHLILKSKRLHIKFINNETQTETHAETNTNENTDTQCLLNTDTNEENLESNTEFQENQQIDQKIKKIVAVRNRNSYSIKNTKRNRRLLKQYNLKQLCNYNKNKDIWKLRDSAIESIPLEYILQYVSIKSYNQKKKSDCWYEDYDNCEL